MVPLVSVVVSTYRGEAHIRGCLEMLERQTAADRIEIIVIDSGSPEHERAIVEELQARHSNIIYQRTPRETLYAAWNRALALARGTYFANVNVDDWIRDDALELFALALDRHPDSALAYAHWAMTDSAQQAPTDTDLVAFHAPYEPAMSLFYCYGGCTQFWRRASLVDLGGFDGSFTACGDLDVLIRLAAAGGNAVLVPQVLEGFFQNPEGISRSNDVALREQFALFADARATIKLSRLFAIDPADVTSLAAGWVALGNLAVHLRVPWHDSRLGDVGFALECYERALAVRPDDRAALHNKYTVLFEAGRFDDAEQSISGIPGEVAARVRGAEISLSQPDIAPAVKGYVFDGCTGLGRWANHPLTGRRAMKTDPVAQELTDAKEYIASLEFHLAAEQAESAKLRAALADRQRELHEL